MSLTLILTLIPTLKNSSKRREKEIHRELINKILYSFEISIQVTKKSSHKMGALYIKLLYRIENVNFNIKKIVLFSDGIPNN